MATKQAIVREPGSEEILLPERIAQALIGNDHVKMRLCAAASARASVGLVTTCWKSERAECNWPISVFRPSLFARPSGVLSAVIQFQNSSSFCI